MASANPLTDLFGRSPIRPIQAHMSKVYATASLLTSFFEATQKGAWDKAGEVQKEISAMEREADKLKTSVRQNLPKSLFMPVSRSDLLGLLGMQDSIANCSKDIAGLMLGRKMTFPEPLQEAVLEYVMASIATCEQAMEATNELEKLIGVGFGTRELRVISAKIKALDKLERRTDKLQVKLRAKLFRLEEALPPVEVIFLYKIIDLIGELGDIAEKVGSRLQILVSV